MTPTVETGKQDREGLRDLAVEAGGLDLVDHDLVGGSQDFEALRRDFAEDADGQARAGERVTPDDIVGQAQVFADHADLVLEEVAQRLDQLEAELGGQAADVVVQLDVGGLAGRPVAGLDHVRVERALGEEPGVRDLAGLGLEHLDELVADDLALLLRVGHAGQGREEWLDQSTTCRSIWKWSRKVETSSPARCGAAGRCPRRCRRAGRRWPGGAATAVTEESTPPQRPQMTVASPDLLADGLDRLGDEVAHLPVAGAAADVVEEVVQDLRAFGRVA